MRAPDVVRICFDEYDGDHVSHDGEPYTSSGEYHEYIRADIAEMDWQQIDTAPKDGRAIDLWVKDTAGNGFRYPDAAFDFVGEDMGWTDSNHHGAIEPDVRPTHWMPQPEPPK